MTGSIHGMAKEKATITVDRAKVEQVRSLTGAASVSEAIDLALGEVIRLERLRHDVHAYRATPVTDVEIAVALVPPTWSALADDTDWDGLYADDAG